MRIIALHLLLCLWPCLARSLEMEQLARQKRQLDWNGNGRVYHYDHLAVSSDTDEEEDDSSSVYAAQVHSPSGLPGEPGIDYPILPSIPLTDFHCRGRVPGFYGDTQTACQVFHVCDMSGRQDSFLCPNGTIFSQQLFACDWWYNVKCSATRQHYQLNSNLFKGSNLNLYGTPSFWNWLTETEEVYPKPGSTRPPSVRPKTPPPKTVYQQLKSKFVAQPAPVIPTVRPAAPFIPVAEPEQFEQLPQPQRFQQPIQQVEEIQEFEEVEEEQPIQHFSQPEPTLQPEPITPAPERFVSSVQPAPVVVATTPPTPSDEEQMEGFTRDYHEHYFGWINDAVHPPSPDMVPELSWTDLGPNGPRMSGDDHLIVPTPVVDRRRKAKPIQQQHPTKPSLKKQQQQHSARPTAPPRPVFVPKPAPVKKQISAQSPKHFAPAPTAPPRFVPTQSTPKFTQPPKKFVSTTTFAPIFTPSTPLPLKQKLIKQKPIKQLTTQPVTKTTTTTNRPTANSDYFYDDDVYDDSPIRQPDQASQKSRAAIKNRPDGSSRRQSKTKFVPSPRITSSRSDDLIARPYQRPTASKFFQQTTSRPTSAPVWSQQRSVQSRFNSVSARLPWRSSSSIVPVTTTTSTTRPPVVPSKRGKPIHQPDARSFRQLASPSGVVMERFAPTFRPSHPIPAITSNSNQPRVRAQRAHPSPPTGAKRRRAKKTSSMAYDPRLGRPYGENHPIYKLQNWESTKI